MRISGVGAPLAIWFAIDQIFCLAPSRSPDIDPVVSSTKTTSMRGAGAGGACRWTVSALAKAVRAAGASRAVAATSRAKAAIRGARAASRKAGRDGVMVVPLGGGGHRGGYGGPLRLAVKDG